MLYSTLLSLLVILVLAGCSSPTQPQVIFPSPSPPSAVQKSTPGVVTTISAAPAGCTVISPKPSPGPTEVSLFPPVSEGEWVKGPETASITFIEYGDFM